MLPTIPDLTHTCKTYYEETFQISEFWWWIFREPNCGFDWDGYYARVLNGPAFDGVELFWQTTTSSSEIVPIFMWFIDNRCSFSLYNFNNTEENSSGFCSI